MVVLEGLEKIVDALGCNYFMDLENVMCVSQGMPTQATGKSPFGLVYRT